MKLKLMKQQRQIILLLSVCLLVCGCFSEPKRPGNVSNGPSFGGGEQIRIASIPQAIPLMEAWKKEFLRAHSDVDLRIRSLDPASNTFSFDSQTDLIIVSETIKEKVASQTAAPIFTPLAQTKNADGKPELTLAATVGEPKGIVREFILFAAQSKPAKAVLKEQGYEPSH